LDEDELPEGLSLQELIAYSTNGTPPVKSRENWSEIPSVQAVVARADTPEDDEWLRGEVEYYMEELDVVINHRAFYVRLYNRFVGDEAEVAVDDADAWRAIATFLEACEIYGMDDWYVDCFLAGHTTVTIPLLEEWEQSGSAPPKTSLHS
jgi:hypothetical protein